MQARLPGLRRHRPSGEKQFAGGEGLPYRGRNTPVGEKRAVGERGSIGKGTVCRRKSSPPEGRGCPIEGGIPPSERNGPSKKEGPSGKARSAGGGKAVRGGFGRGVVAGCQPHGPLSDPHREIVARIPPPRRSWPVQGIPHPAAKRRRAILFMQRFRLLPPPIRQPCPTVPVARRRAQTTAWIMCSGTATLCGRRKKTIE